MLLVMVGFASAGCGSTSATQAVLPTFLAPQESATPLIDTASYPTVQAPEVNTSQTVSGYVVSLQRAWRDGKQVYADVCFTLPDTSDWTIWNAHFDYGGQVVSEFSSSMLSEQGPVNGQAGQRCDELGFFVPPDADLSAASLTVESLGAAPSQSDYCLLYMPKIQQTLTERGIAITLGCTEVNGALIMQILSKPEAMSQEQAEQIVFSDEFYTIRGPWVFPVSLGQ
jgi:hypothetical protein